MVHSLQPDLLQSKVSKLIISITAGYVAELIASWLVDVKMSFCER